MGSFYLKTRMRKTNFVLSRLSLACGLAMAGLTLPAWAAEETPALAPTLSAPGGALLDPFETRSEMMRRKKREQEKEAELEARKKELSPNAEESLIQVQAQAVVDFWAKSSGGVPALEQPDGSLAEPETSAVLGYMDIHSSIDTQEVNLWDNGEFYARLLFTFGTSPSAFAGDLQGISNVDARGYEVGKLMELWYEHEFPYSHSDLRVGMQDVKDRFYQMEYTRLFVNKSLGLDSVFLHAGEMPTYPNAAIGLSYHAWLTPTFYWSGGVYDGTPGATDEYFNTSLNANEGVLSMFETGYVTGERYSDKGYWRIAAGGWYLKKELRQVTSVPEVSEQRIQENASYNFASWQVDRPGVGGFYLMGEVQMVDNLGGFVKFAMADQTINRIYQYYALGLHVRGLIPGREMDELGMALMHSRQSPLFLRNNPRMYIWEGDNAASAEALPGETTIEFTYQAKMRHWLKFQPNVQFVQSPGMSAFNAAAVVMGVRLIADY